MSYDYSRLKGKIIEKYGSNAKFAEDMDWSERTLSLKLNNKVAWKQPEIVKAIGLLSLDENDITGYFFKLKVQIEKIKKYKETINQKIDDLLATMEHIMYNEGMRFNLETYLLDLDDLKVDTEHCKRILLADAGAECKK